MECAQKNNLESHTTQYISIGNHKESNKKWSREDDEKLISVVESTGKPFKRKDIATHFKDKNVRQCYFRYEHINKNYKKGSWTDQEKKLLNELVQTHGKRWAKISRIMKTRSGKQIRDHYICTINREKNKFTKEEDEKLKNLFLQFGNKFSFISQYLPGKSTEEIKNRFHSSIKKTLIKTSQLEFAQSLPEPPRTVMILENFVKEKEPKFLINKMQPDTTLKSKFQTLNITELLDDNDEESSLIDEYEEKTFPSNNLENMVTEKIFSESSNCDKTLYNNFSNSLNDKDFACLDEKYKENGSKNILIKLIDFVSQQKKKLGEDFNWCMRHETQKSYEGNIFSRNPSESEDNIMETKFNSMETFDNNKIFTLEEEKFLKKEHAHACFPLNYHNSIGQDIDNQELFETYLIFDH